MTESECFREQLIQFIEKHKEYFVTDYDRLIEIIKDKNESIPIRAIMYNMKSYDPSKYTDDEKEMLREAMHNYG